LNRLAIWRSKASADLDPVGSVGHQLQGEHLLFLAAEQRQDAV
jgi:hypothetical protein